MLALMGDTIDNIKGVPGHRREGRARSDRHATASLDALLAHAARGHAEALSRGAARARRRRAAEPRAGADPHRRAGRRSTPTRCAIAARRASAATSCSRGSASARWSRSTRRRADTVGKDYALVRTLDELRRAGRRRSRRPADSRLRVLPDAPSAMRAGDRRPRVLDRAAAGALRAARPATATRSARSSAGARAASTRDALAALKPLLEDRVDRARSATT